MIIRVRQALNGSWPGGLIWGELQVNDKALTEEEGASAWQAKLDFCRCHHLAFIGSFQAEEISYIRKDSSLYCFGLVSGPFSLAADQLGWLELLRFFADQPSRVKDVIAESTKVSKECIDALVDAGCHGIVLGDDIFSSQGPLFSRQHFIHYLAPSYSHLASYIRAKGVDAVFHCCGNAYRLADWLEQQGWQGLHGFNEFMGRHQQPAGFCFLGGLSPLSAAKGNIPRELSASRGPDKPFLLCSSGGLHTSDDIKWAKTVYALLQGEIRR